MSNRSISTSAWPLPTSISPPEHKSLDHFEKMDARALHTPSTPTQRYAGSSSTYDCPGQLRNAPFAEEPPSPPASPWAAHQKKIVEFENSSTTHIVGDYPHDPLLYCDEGSAASQEPLFASSANDASKDSWRGEVRYHFVRPKSKSDSRIHRYRWPTEDEYTGIVRSSLALHKSYNANPGTYLKRVREEILRARKVKRGRIITPSRTAFRDVKSSPSILRRGNRQETRNSSKRISQPRGMRRPGIGQASTALDRPKAPHTRAPSIKRPEDVNFAALPDFSPSTHLLPNNKALKIEWTSHNPLDLSSDPHRDLLHEAEVSLASTLRLSCATYLCSKRRIFMKVCDAYESGKEFRKTDAQQACQIDVNKASKLWVAFEKVGWFKKAHFERFLNQNGAA